jgi:hypothetical protein
VDDCLKKRDYYRIELDNCWAFLVQKTAFHLELVQIIAEISDSDTIILNSDAKQVAAT